MGLKSRLLLNQAAFTADTQTMNIPVENVKDLEYGVLALDALGASTLAHMLGNFDEVLVTLGGYNICKLLVIDNIAYGILALDHYPEFLLGGNTTLLNILGGLKLPLWVTKGPTRELNCQFTWGATNAAITTPTLSVEYQYRDRKFDRHFAYQYESHIGAANQQWTGMSRKGADLIGVLIYNCNEDIGTNTTVAPEIAEIEMLVDDRVVYHANIATFKAHHSIWNSYDTSETYGPDFAATGGWNSTIDDHYKYIDFSDEPWPADKLSFITQNTCQAYTGGSNGACRLVGVYTEL